MFLSIVLHLFFCGRPTIMLMQVMKPQVHVYTGHAYSLLTKAGSILNSDMHSISDTFNTLRAVCHFSGAHIMLTLAPPGTCLRPYTVDVFLHHMNIVYLRALA